MVTIQSSPAVRFSAVKAPAGEVRFQGLSQGNKTEYILADVLTELDEKVRIGDSTGVQAWLEKDGLKLQALDPRQWNALDAIWHTVGSPSIDCNLTSTVLKNFPRGFRRQKLQEMLEKGDYETAAALKDPDYAARLERSNQKLEETLDAYREQAATRRTNVSSLNHVLESLEDPQLVSLQRGTIEDLQSELEQLDTRIDKMDTKLQREKNRPQRLDKERALKEAVEKGNLDLLAEYGFSEKRVDQPSKLVQRLTGQRKSTLRELGQVFTSLLGRGGSSESSPAQSDESTKKKTESTGTDLEVFGRTGFDEE